MQKHIWVIDEQSSYRKGMMKLVEINFPSCHVEEYGISTTYDDLEKLPDVVIIDPTFSMQESVEIVGDFIQKGIDVVIFSSIIDEESFVLDLLKHPIKGFLLKKMDTAELIRSLDNILKGKKYIHPSVANILLSHYQNTANF